MHCNNSANCFGWNIAPFFDLCPASFRVSALSSYLRYYLQTASLDPFLSASYILRLDADVTVIKVLYFFLCFDVWPGARNLALPLQPREGLRLYSYSVVIYVFPAFWSLFETIQPFNHSGKVFSKIAFEPTQRFRTNTFKG